MNNFTGISYRVTLVSVLKIIQEVFLRRLHVKLFINTIESISCMPVCVNALKNLYEQPSLGLPRPNLRL